MKNKEAVSSEPQNEPEVPVASLREAIAQLAYSYWEADGRPPGSDMRYWLRAEREVLAERGLPGPDDEGGA